ncbi:protein-L-isoaspartate(D-aspartate) O-methyltransferase, partial [Undibacterium sp.]|uniref:protein-L-isoaspartate(D-aspartate) O-methyltransferase n=1 Tax=Undibacterium sp. TaxID=1914977 RepID=UPI0037515073
MTTKEKRFPLSLSAVVDQRGAVRQNATARPQTAVQNAATNNRNSQSQTSSIPKLTKSSTPPQIVPASGVGMVSDKIRQAMVARVAQQGVKDPLALAALEAIPRHLFLESGLASQAYIDASLPIGHHQTISQPYIVARMVEILRNGKNLSKVLEIGTGCGYQAAVLSLVAKEVYSIERIKALHELAKVNLRPMRIANIRLHYGDGMLGLPQSGPFDGIILAAAGLEVPHALLEQLTIGGRLIAPVGNRHQVLQLVERLNQHEWNST